MPTFGLPAITAIAIGTLIGGVAQFAIQWPLLRREGFAYKPTLKWRDEGLRRVLVLMGPGTVGVAATQVNVFVNTVLATSQGTGAVSWLNFAFRLMYLPIGLFGVSIATATLPAVSRHAARQDKAAVRNTIADGISLMLMLNVPATLGLIVLATPIVRIIFERGAFTPADTAATASALQFYGFGLLGYSVVRIVSPAFYALGRARTPVQVSVATVLFNAALNIVLAQVLGYRGLALGTSIAALFNATLLLTLLRRHLEGLEGRRVAASMLKISVASTLMAATALALDAWMPALVPGGGFVPQAIRLAASIGGAGIVLAVSAHALHISEFRRGMALVTRRFSRKR
jgi:putative peptidoglycan lipid II flippase